MPQLQSPKRKKKRKKSIFCCNALRKNGFLKKNCEIFLPILDALAKLLLIINSKHPTETLGFREFLEFGQ